MRLTMVVIVGSLLAGSVLAQQAQPAPQASPTPTPKLGALTQAGFGIFVNLLAEFWPGHKTGSSLKKKPAGDTKKD